MNSYERRNLYRRNHRVNKTKKGKDTFIAKYLIIPLSILTTSMFLYANYTPIQNKPLEKSALEQTVSSRQHDKLNELKLSELEEDIINFNVAELESIKNALKKDPEYVANILKEEWKEIYSNGQKYGLEKAIGISKDEIATVKQIFKDNGVPEKLAFLAIPESHWGNKQPSWAGAKGIFQFTPSTGKDNGLVYLTKTEKVNGKEILNVIYDERENNYLSAISAAQHLGDLYIKFNKDWDLALAAYNSGKPYKYLKKKDLFGNGQVSHKNYLLFLADELEGIIKEVNKMRKYGAKVEMKEGNTLSSLVHNTTGMNLPESVLKEIGRMNGIKDIDKIREGKKIYIHPKYIGTQEALYELQCKFIKENLQYPPKYNAVVELLQNKYRDYFNTPTREDIKIIYVNQKGIDHKVTEGDTLWSISRKYNISVDEIEKANKIVENSIKVGQTLQLKQGITLEDISNTYSIPFDIVKELNPQVKHFNKYLPEGAKIVLPLS